MKRPLLGVDEAESGVNIALRVQPKASRSAVLVEDDGRIRVALTAPPVDGAANKSLIEVIAGVLNVPKRSVRLVGGEKSRNKTVHVDGITVEAVRAALNR